MPRQTENYKLGYFLEGEYTSASTDLRRFNTIDYQLRGMYEVLGSGVQEGWDLSTSDTDAFSLNISAGKGVIGLVYVSSSNDQIIGPFTPDATFHIYANKTSRSYWTSKVNFSGSVSLIDLDDESSSVYLGTVTTDASGISDINIDNRKYIGFLSSIRSFIQDHRHTGIGDNPEPVDLATEVEGRLGQGSIPDLDASIITTGILDANRLPKIDHEEKLTNKGVLTHPQLDTMAQLLLGQNQTKLGETAISNFLQLVLSLKDTYPNIDDLLYNTVAFIPGVSPDSLIDYDNTTATVDTVGKKIVGTAGTSYENFTHTWSSQKDWDEWDQTRVFEDTDHVRISSVENSVSIENFENVSDWESSIIDLADGGSSSIEIDNSKKTEGTYSGKLSVSGEVANLRLQIEKTLTPADWSEYNRLTFYINTADANHGDLYFYLNDLTSGVQDSEKIILQEGDITINRDTLLQGWREMSVDISGLDRSTINTIGFYTTSQSGWDASKDLSINFDNMFLTTGNTFEDNGYLRVVYGDSIPKLFDKVTTDTLMPSGTSLQIKTRLGNSTSDFDDTNPSPPPWIATDGSGSISNPTGNLYKYIQIEAYLESDSSNLLSPEVHRLNLIARNIVDESSFTYDTQSQWESATLVNLDTIDTPGSITISNSNDLGSFLVGTDGEVRQYNSDFNKILDTAGSSLPRSTYQAINGLPPSFGQLSGVCAGADNTLWVADTDNDRVLNINKAGGLVRGFYGSFIKDPTDVYGIEEQGPGSNESVPSPEDEDGVEKTSLNLLHSIYNDTNHVLTMVFDDNLSAPSVVPELAYIKVGTRRFYLNDAEFSLLGVDSSKADIWRNSDNEFAGQFNLDAHVLQAKLSQNEYAAMEEVIGAKDPFLSFSNAYEQQLVYTDTFELQFETRNIVINGTDNNRISLVVNGGTPKIVYSDRETISLPSDGVYEVVAKIIDSAGAPLPNMESRSEVTLIKTSEDEYSLPHIAIKSPIQYDKTYSNKLTVDFEANNHPVLSSGPHLSYILDTDEAVEHRSLEPISLDLDAGEHTVQILLVDSEGNEISETYSSATTTFYVKNPDTNISLILDKGFVSSDSEIESGSSNEGVDIGNIYFSNIFSPIDVTFDTEKQSVLIAKLRSKSSTGNLNSESAEGSEIFLSMFMDGHSVVELDYYGNLLFSNNAALFELTKEDAKRNLGSASKLADNYILTADSYRNRAIITATDLENEKTFVTWEYLSDRKIIDAQPASDENVKIKIYDDKVVPNEIFIRNGTTITWENHSSDAVTVYSGNTNTSSFNLDPDLTLYGDDFSSDELSAYTGGAPDTYSFKFSNTGNFSFFIHPSIVNENVTGKISVQFNNPTNQSDFLLVEADAGSSIYGNRVILIDTWGNIKWNFGEGMLYNPKDARVGSNGTYLISA